MARASAKDTTNSKMRLFDTRHDLEPDVRQQMIELLNAQLADTFDMFSITKQAHWVVKGQEFFQLHELYDTIAEGLLEHVDTIAERATALGGLTRGTVKMAAQASRLDDYPLNVVESLDTVDFVAGCMARLAASTRQAADQAEEAKDMATNDLFIEVVRDLDKWLWFLEAHLQGKSR